ncbi:hypothetical protein BDP67DRAFT_394129, partial [Colletotrichum lupini]
NNNNNYTLGRVNTYNVVITILFNREYSINTAIAVARNILYSFPNIRIRLIINISSGALSPKYNI